MRRVGKREKEDDRDDDKQQKREDKGKRSIQSDSVKNLGLVISPDSLE